MLFDLRDPRRKNAIRAVYATLAVLMGGGLILFGIGGEVGGGLIDSLTGSGGGTSFDDQIEEAEQRVEENPRDQEAWLDVAAFNLQAGNAQVEGIDEQTGYPIVGSDTEESFNTAADAWERYLALDPQRPDSGVALQLANAFFILAVNADSAAEARRALATAADAQIVAANQSPTLGNLRQLTQYLYFAGEFGRAERAAERTVEQAPGGERAQVRRQLQQIEDAARSFEGQVRQEAQGPGGGENPLDASPGALGGGGALSTP